MSPVLLPTGEAICARCDRLHPDLPAAEACRHGHNELAYVVGALALWLCALTLLVIMPAYIAWH